MIEKILLQKEVWIVWGPLGIWALLTTVACVQLWKAYCSAQDQRLEDAKAMYASYHRLAEEINKTLELVLKLRHK